MNNFSVIVSETPWNTTYIKVVLCKSDMNIKNVIENLDSVKTVNPDSKGGFTVYVQSFSSAIEAKEQIENALYSYFNRTPIEEIKVDNYKKAKALFKEAMDKYNTGNQNRNCLDDFRLSLELFLKELLSNDKSLENQKKELGSYLEKKGLSTENRDCIIMTLNQYTKYQNEHVKHSNNISENDLRYIVKQTKYIFDLILDLERGK